MSKYIDAEKLKAEIKAREKVHFEDYHIKKSGGPADYGAANALHQLLPFIDSLQQEQPELPGIEDPGIPGKDFIPVEWVDACKMYGKWKIVKQEQPDVDLEKEIEEYFPESDFYTGWNYDDVVEVARDFWNKGYNARKK